MPVRSLSSSVLRWPDSQAVIQALHRWTEKAGQNRPDVLRIGYFGSYARGDWGVGSDVDLLIIVERSGQSFERRSIEWNTAELPVPADVLVYTRAEWQSLSQQRQFHQALRQEIVWIYVKESILD